jgi:hypothetical protein
MRGPVDEGTARRARAHVVGRVRVLYLACVRALGYLAFVVALAALAAAARLLGRDNELGFFAGRLNSMIWRYPEVTRRGVQMAWLMWIALFLLALSPVDPIPSRWDEILLGALALGIVWRQAFAEHRVGR